VEPFSVAWLVVPVAVKVVRVGRLDGGFGDVAVAIAVVGAAAGLFILASAALTVSSSSSSSIIGTGLPLGRYARDIFDIVVDRHARGCKFLGSLVAAVVVWDNINDVVFWYWWHLAATKEHRAPENMVPFQRPILLFELAVQVRDEKEKAYENNTTSDAKNTTESLGVSPAIQFQRGRWNALVCGCNGSGALGMSTSFPYDEHGENPRCDTEVYWNHQKAHVEGMLPPEYTVLCDQENNSCETAGNCRSDEPSGDDLCNALVVPSPRNGIGTNECDTRADDAADDAMSVYLLALIGFPKKGTYVVETGNPSLVAAVTHVEDAIKAHIIPSMSIVGSASKYLVEMILLRIVSATRDLQRQVSMPFTTTHLAEKD
jgi:hypothetical protein